MEHECDIYTYGVKQADKSFQAVCTNAECGWYGKLRVSQPTAEYDASAHETNPHRS